jgi:imidazolonepropionase-like amidohydrolase
MTSADPQPLTGPLIRRSCGIAKSDTLIRICVFPQLAWEYNPAFLEVAVKRWTILPAALISLLGLVSVSWAQKSVPAPAPVTMIRAGVLIDGVSGSARRDVIITIRGNKIIDVADGGTTFPINIPADMPAGSTLIDLSGATVLPGLIDAHTHIFLQGEDPAEGGYDIQLLKYPLAFRAARATVSARRALEQGFTTLRDMETEGYGDVGIKMAIEGGYIPGPRLFVSTRAISTTGGYPLEGYAPEIEVPKGVQIIDGPVEARKAAREQLDHGADWIKVYMTHRSWVTNNGVGKNGELVSQPTLTVEELRAIVDETHGWGKRVACHVYGGEGMQRALDGGCDSIEHGLVLTDAQIAQMIRQGTWLCATLSIYYEDWAPADTPAGQRDRKRASEHEASFRKAVKAGVKIAFGTDIGGMPWSEPIAQEFPRMVEFGMTPMQAIQSATSRAAELLEMQGRLGVIAPGAYADVVAVAGDPLTNIKTLENVGFVMKDGKVFKNELAGKK